MLVDRILDYKKDESITGLKNVTANEPFFEGHFPDEPVMPGVLILEAMAQICGVLTSLTLEKKLGMEGVFYLVGFDKARFKRMVVPGDQVILKTSIKRKLKGIWKFEANAYVDDELVASADLMCTYKES
jgi:3-hydroxyacyl-[acyl-carrier-protein] dehydratase